MTRSWLARRRGNARVDDGQILVLATGLVVVFLLLVSVIVSITGLHLERTRLRDLADCLALAGADSMTLGGMYDADQNLLTDDGVAAAVASYLAAHPGLTAGLGEVEVVVADAPDGKSARVVLRSMAKPTLVSSVTSVFSDGTELIAQGTAQAW